MKKLFLLDAYSLIFRAHYAFIKRPITTSKGFDTSAVFGFIKSLQEILNREQPTHIAVVFDHHGGSFRRRIFPEYKANRLQTPEQIIAAVPVIKEILKAYKIPIFEVPDYEADDIIGAIAKTGEQKGFNVFMVTPDKDYGQLVSDKIFMYKPKHSGNEVEILGRIAICQRYGIEKPEQVIDILALWGDAADNVPGAPGIGEVTAVKLIKKYGDIDGIYSHIDEMKGKQKESLVNSEAQVRLSKKLVTIVTDIPVEWDEKDLETKKPDVELLKNIYAEYEFYSLLRDFYRNGEQKSETEKHEGEQLSLFSIVADKREIKSHRTVEHVPHSYYMAISDSDITRLIKKLENSTEFCFDTETTGLNPFESRLVGMSFALQPHEAWYVPVFPNNPQKTQELTNRFKQVFENPNIAKTGQNLKFDIEVLKNVGIEVDGAMYDSMLMHYLLNPDSRHNMDYLSEIYLNYSPIPIEALIGTKGASQRTMDVVPLDKVREYAAEDADVTLQLKTKFLTLLKNKNMLKLYEQIEAPLITVLADMETSGVCIDRKCLKELKVQYSAELDEIEREIKEIAGEPELNISSPKQLGAVLFDKLKIGGSKVKTTKTRQYATDEETLLAYKDTHPIIDKILEYRSLKKLLSTYIEALPTLINRRTGKIHTSFNQAVTSTGRLSSNNPNLQNIPIREARGREIRKAFVPSDEDHILLAADYSQIELRLMAHFSEDESMIEAFCNNEDIHAATAAKIYKIPVENVTREQRSAAKTANFGIIYGISSFGLAQRLKISRTDAKQLIDGYFKSYPKVKLYMDRVIAEAQKNGSVETLFGRRRQLNDINSGNAMIRGMAERYAINAPIQGTAADIIKIAMININQVLKKRKMKTAMILQVHDELVFDVFAQELEEIKRIVVTNMQYAVRLKVPLTVECGYGTNWLQAH
ncbi:MAG: DNA polymerase I [Prevotellaceae bacterium]|nr:DNA polymerase I [Prevotellaceae bacterium]